MNINSESQNVNPVLVEALALAKSGMYVYPTPKKNGPAHIKWRKGSSTDPATITAWWRKWPNALIGLDCERSGIAAIDADTIKGHGVDGIATLTMLELEHGDLPPTWMQESPSGSKHYLFKGKIKTTAGEVNEKGEVYALGAGVDTRGHGGMIVLAPSHVKGKGSYKRLNDLAPADLPQWVSDLAGVAEVLGPVPDAEFDPTYTQAEFAERLALIDVKQFDGKHDEWLSLMLACTHATTVEDGKQAFMDWTTNHGNGEYAGEYDAISTRVDHNFRNRNMAGKAARVGTFNKFLTDAGHGDKAFIGGRPTTAMEDFANDPLPSEKFPYVRPAIAVKAGQLPRMTREAQAGLIRDAAVTPGHVVRSGQPGETVFQRAGAIVHLSRNDKKLAEGQVDENYHEKNALLSIPAKRGWLADRIDSAITFKRFARPAGAPTKDVEPADASAKDVKPADAKKIKKGTWVDCDVPKELVVRLLELSTKWKFPALAGTIEAPTLRKDGTVLDVPGYDPKSGLFFDPGGVVFRKVTDKPTKKEMVDSLALLKDVIRDFPFVDDDDDESAEGENRGRLSRAVALAGMLLAVSRRSLPTAPAIGIDANQAQTGKTLLAQVMAIMNTGRKTAERPLSGSEEERRKTIGSALVAADPVILFDNIEGMSIGGAFISMVLTAESFADRKLGVHEQIGAPTNALMLFTGNHLTVAGDATAGRVLISKIVTETKLKDRKFEHRDLETYVKENRPALVHAALTILRGFIVADRPGIPSRSRFREFGDLIGNALVYLGEMDPCLSEDAVQILDPIKEGQSSVARAWWKEFRDAPVTVRKLLDYAEPTPETRGDDYSRYTHPIAVAIADALDIRLNDVTGQKAASFLTSCVGVDLGDFRVHRERKTSALNHAVRWRCERRPDPLD